MASNAAQQAEKERVLVAYESRLLGREAATTNRERALVLRERQVQEGEVDVVAQQKELAAATAATRAQRDMAYEQASH